MQVVERARQTEAHSRSLEQQRRAGGPRRIGQSRPPNRQRPLIRSLSELIDGVGHRERDERGSAAVFAWQ